MSISGVYAITLVHPTRNIVFTNNNISLVNRWMTTVKDFMS